MGCLPNYLIIHQHLYVLMSRNPFYMEYGEACLIPLNYKYEDGGL